MDNSTKRRWSRSTLTGLAAGVVVLALGGGVAFATIPGSGGVIHGCYLKLSGVVRVIDAGFVPAGRVAVELEPDRSAGSAGPAGSTRSAGSTGPAGAEGRPRQPGPRRPAGLRRPARPEG